MERIGEFDVAFVDFQYAGVRNSDIVIGVCDAFQHDIQVEEITHIIDDVVFKFDIAPLLIERTVSLNIYSENDYLINGLLMCLLRYFSGNNLQVYLAAIFINEIVRNFYSGNADMRYQSHKMVYEFMFPPKNDVVELSITSGEKTVDCPKNKIIHAQSLLMSFKDNVNFEFLSFAKVNNIPFDHDYIPHAYASRYNFCRMHRIVTQLIDNGIYIKELKKSIKLTDEDLVMAYDNIGVVADNCEMSYRFFGELGKIIYQKLLSVVTLLEKHNICLDIETGSWLIHDIIADVFSLPLVNVSEGVDLGIKIFQFLKEGGISAFNDNHFQVLMPSDGERNLHDELFAKFQRLGIFFIFQSEELAEQILISAQFLASIGMQLPVFIVEFKHDGGKQIGGLSNTICGVELNKKLKDEIYDIKDLETGSVVFSVPRSQKTFYHENIHHVRQSVGALKQGSNWMPSMNTLLGREHNLIGVIKHQVSEYALTDHEEYLAEFGAKILCCLQMDENPLDYITDKKLWRLYYELGGPDFLPIIYDKFYKDNYDILNDENRCYGHLSGYPKKFEIDLNRLENKQVSISGLKGLNVVDKETLTDTTILPPPPLGYKYTTDNKKLQLKPDVDVLRSHDNEYYDPVFCRLTNGTLTLIKTEPKFERHLKLINHYD